MSVKYARFKNELKQKCLSCGDKAVNVGYWDEELQFYLYFEERFLCCVCLKRSAVFYEKMRQFISKKWQANI